MKKSKKKKKKATESTSGPVISKAEDNTVMLGVRMSIAEREKIKMYALMHRTTVAELIREYIASLPDPLTSS